MPPGGAVPPAGSRAAGRPAAVAEGGPDGDLVTVIVPARDEERSIGATLDSLRGQDHRRLQIVVVDGGSTDGTRSVVERHMAEDPRVELLDNPRQAIPVALNLALAAARGPWLVRMDAHSTVGAGYVTAALARLREGRWGGVGGRKDGVGTTPAGRAIAAALGSRFGVGGSVYHHGASAQEVDHIPFGAYPTELVRELGGWDERLVANEDFEFDHRLRLRGHVLLFDPRLQIAWQSKQSVRELLAQYRRYGRGKADVAQLHPASLRPRHLLPPALVLYLVLAAAAGLRRPAVTAAMVAPYAAALAVATTLTARTVEDPRSRMYLPPAFLAMHLGWGAGFCTRTLEHLLGRAGR